MKVGRIPGWLGMNGTISNCERELGGGASYSYT